MEESDDSPFSYFLSKILIPAIPNNSVPKNAYTQLVKVGDNSVVVYFCNKIAAIVYDIIATIHNNTINLLNFKRIRRSGIYNFNISYFEAQGIYNHFKQTQEFPYIGQKDILLIDDLGVEPQSYNDFGEIRYPLAELLMLRYKQNRPTIIATNCTFEQIGEIYGDRLQDRMKEMYAVITYKEPSYRG